MNKDEVFDVAVKGCGICLLCFAVYFLAHLLSVMAVLLAHTIVGFGSMVDGREPYWSYMLRQSSIGDIVASVVKLSVFLAAARNFLTTGSLVRWFTRNKQAEPHGGG